LDKLVLDIHKAVVSKSPVEGVLAVSLASNRCFPRHSHDEFGIGVISTGGQQSWSGRGLVHSLPGDVITVNAGEVHDGLPIGGCAREWRMLFIDATTMQSMTEHSGIPFIEFREPSANNPRIRCLFEQADAIAKGQTTQMAFETALLELLVYSLRSKTFLPIKAHKNVQRVCDAINQSPATAWTLTELATLSALSRFELIRAFRKETGVTPHAYLVQRRVRLVRSLIASGETLIDASIMAGFADQSHMTRAFVRQYGFTPGAFASLR
jgi:AraC-like DNA-binding protein